MKMLGFSKVALHESAWELWFFVENMGIWGEKWWNLGQKCGNFGGEHPGIHGEKFFLGGNVGILVKTVGIFKACTPRIRLGAVGFLWKSWEFGGKMMGFGSKMWEFWGWAPRSPWGGVLFGGKSGNFGENCWDFQSLHSTNPPGSCGIFVEKLGIWGENDGIWVKNVGILGVSTQESMGRRTFWGKKWEFWFKLLGFWWKCWDFQSLDTTNPPGSCDFLWKK